MLYSAYSSSPLPITVPRLVETTFSATASITGLTFEVYALYLVSVVSGAGQKVATSRAGVKTLALGVNSSLRVICFITLVRDV